ncbi:MAG TPA: hypothetical protein VIP05_23425 [Burkholderiaceae bacterium]
MTDQRSRNPFPFQGTLSMEGSAQHAFSASDVRLPNIDREPIRRAWTHIEGYLQRFDRTAVSTGQVVAFRGPHGSGKTHTIHVLFDRVAEWGQANPGKAPFQIYVKAEGPDFVWLYQQAVTTIPESLLKELSLRFLASLVDRELTGGSAAVRKELEADPQRVFALFEQYEVEKGQAEELQAAEVRRVAGGLKDFHRVLGYLLSRDLGSAAYDWLLNRPVSPELMRRLGVTGPISSASDAKLALQLLVTLFTRSGTPLIIYIDQYEKLVLVGGKAHDQNVGLMHSLVEFIPRESGMLLMSGNLAAWESLPVDFKQRFPTANTVEFPILAFGEANLLLRTYLAASDAEFDVEDRSTNGLEPFTDGAVREVTKFSAGNVRRFLQLSALVWQRASDERRLADSTLVRNVIKESANRRYFDQRSVRDLIGEMLREGDCRFRQNVQSGDHTVDFLVQSRSGASMMAIDVKEAFFHLDEATKALESLDTRAALASNLPVTRYTLVVLGYISPEIVSRVEGVVDELIVYDTETFADRFKASLDRLARLAPAPSAAHDDGGLQKQIAEMREALAKIAESRALDNQVVDGRIATLLERQGVDRLNERRQAAREAWAAERREIEDRIRGARAQRRAEQTAELQRLAADARDTQRSRARALGLAVMVLPVVLAVIYLPDLFRSSSYSYDSYSAKTAIQVLVFAVIAAVVVGLSPYWRDSVMSVILPSRTQLQAVPGSLENLDAAARAFNNRIENPRQGLYSRFPQERYAAAIHRGLKIDGRVLDAFASEPCAVVRRELARAIGRARPDDGWGEELAGFLRGASPTPEFGYAIEGLARTPKQLESLTDRLPARLRTLAALCGVPADGPQPPSLAQDLATALAQVSRRSPRQEALLDAFNRGPDRVEWSAADLPVGQAQIDAAVAELSPLEASGLAALDELADIRRIDQMYLFMRQVGFLSDRDLLAAPASPAPAVAVAGVPAP